MPEAQGAAKRGLSVQALLEAEVTSKVGLVTEQEIETFYHRVARRCRHRPAPSERRMRTFTARHSSITNVLQRTRSSDRDDRTSQ
jgi:hypothetical protein